MLLCICIEHLTTAIAAQVSVAYLGGDEASGSVLCMVTITVFAVTAKIDEIH